MLFRSLCTFLLDVAPAGIEPPLGQFQHTVFEKDDVRHLVETINKAINANGERSLNEQTLFSVFEKFWPDLELKLNEIAAREEEKSVLRTERALLEEVLEILRSQEQRRLAEMQSKAAWKSLESLIQKRKASETVPKLTLADLLLSRTLPVASAAPLQPNDDDSTGKSEPEIF